MRRDGKGKDRRDQCRSSMKWADLEERTRRHEIVNSYQEKKGSSKKKQETIAWKHKGRAGRRT